jgi:hypothetical protein
MGPKFLNLASNILHGRRGCDRMVVGFTTTCTCAIKTYRHQSCEFGPSSIQHYVMKFVSDLRQVGGLLALKSLYLSPEAPKHSFLVRFQG